MYESTFPSKRLHERVDHHERELRERQGWSQADLTRQLNLLGAGLDRSQVARVETGERSISLDGLPLWALTLDTSILALLFPANRDGVVLAAHENAQKK